MTTGNPYSYKARRPVQMVTTHFNGHGVRLYTECPSTSLEELAHWALDLENRLRANRSLMCTRPSPEFLGHRWPTTSAIRPAKRRSEDERIMMEQPVQLAQGRAPIAEEDAELVAQRNADAAMPAQGEARQGPLNRPYVMYVDTMSATRLKEHVDAMCVMTIQCRGRLRSCILYKDDRTDQYVMRGPKGENRLTCETTSAKRLEAHWDRFCQANDVAPFKR